MLFYLLLDPIESEQVKHNSLETQMVSFKNCVWIYCLRQVGIIFAAGYLQHNIYDEKLLQSLAF